MTASQDRVYDFLRGDFSKSVYVQRARALVPVLKARQQQQWDHPRVLDETIADAQKAGSFQMFLPKRSKLVMAGRAAGHGRHRHRVQARQGPAHGDRLCAIHGICPKFRYEVDGPSTPQLMVGRGLVVVACAA